MATTLVEKYSDMVHDMWLMLNNEFDQIGRLQLITVTFVIAYTIFELRSIMQSDRPFKQRCKSLVFGLIRKIPYIKRKIAFEIAKVDRELKHTIHETDHTRKFFTRLPDNGMTKTDVISLAQDYEQMEGPNYLEGRVSGAVFSNESMEEMDIYKEVYAMFAWSNPLWPKLFPGCRKMEAEVVRMCCDLFQGSDETCGTMTTGGSISILHACLAHRNRALKKGIEFPEIVLPTSAHAAFFKAAELYRLKIVRVQIDPISYKVDVNDMRKKISKRTAMLVASAPNFPFGTIDDIEAIGMLGIEFDIPVHVDACLGGFLLPFARMAGYQVPMFDFACPGVTSISSDTHKYGLTPKGSSVVLYRSAEYLHNQYFCDPDWQGGIYASSTMEGSRCGANIAVCWATMLFYGRDRYMKTSTAVIDTTRKIRDGIAKIAELELMGDSDTCIVSFTSNRIDIHRLHHLMSKQNWHLTNLQFPSGVHIMVTLNHTQNGVADEFIDAVQHAVDEINANPISKPEGAAALYGMAQKLPDRSIVKEFAYSYLDACYSTPSLLL